MASIFAGAFYSLGTGWLPAHLLLLSRRLLQSVLGRSSDGKNFIRHRPRHDRAGHQRVPAQRLYVWMPFLASSDRRISRSNCKIASLLSRLRLCELSESSAHALGMAESVLGRLYRSLYTTLRDGR